MMTTAALASLAPVGRRVATTAVTRGLQGGDGGMGFVGGIFAAVGSIVSASITSSAMRYGAEVAADAATRSAEIEARAARFKAATSAIYENPLTVEVDRKNLYIALAVVGVGVISVALLTRGI